jgi:hypothetical protein
MDLSAIVEHASWSAITFLVSLPALCFYLGWLCGRE